MVSAALQESKGAGEVLSVWGVLSPPSWEEERGL